MCGESAMPAPLYANASMRTLAYGHRGYPAPSGAHLGSWRPGWRPAPHTQQEKDMGLAKISFEVVLTEINCGECGGTYALNERFRQQCQDKGKGWHCPYCRVSWGYYGETEAQRLRKELERKKKELEWKQQEINQAQSEKLKSDDRARSIKALSDRLSTRIKNGVCPCCNRSFENLRRHMETQHPDFTHPAKRLRQLREESGLSQAEIADVVEVPVGYISLFENERPMPEWAKVNLEIWISENY